MRAALFACVLALCAPSAAAWSSPGGAEPDSPQDATWMFADAPSALPAVYFNAFQSSASGIANPNALLIDGHVEEVGPVAYHAYFGAWLDCNGDGYIGAAAGALVDYPAQLLPAGSPCVDGSAFNAGGWVTEMLFVGAVDPCEYDGSAPSSCPVQPQTSRNPTVIYEPSARVWGDVGLPGDAVEGTCPTTPLPPGSTSSTGGLLRFADCQDGAGIASTIDQIGALTGAPVGFEDPQNPQASSSPLNVAFPVSPYENPQTQHAGVLQPGSGDPSFTLWDCAQRRPLASDPTDGGASEVTMRDPSGGALSGPLATPLGAETLFDGDGALTLAIADANGNYAYAPSPAVGDPTGSWYDAANGALDGQHAPGLLLASPTVPGVPAFGADTHADCDAATPTIFDDLAGPATVEDTRAAAPAAPKSTSDWWFTFVDGFKGLAPSHNPGGLVDPRTPTTDGGLAFFRDSDHGGAAWTSEGRSSESPHIVSRAGLGVAGARHVTFYAFAPPSAGALPHATATYGAETCGVIGGGAQPSPHGWSCDPSSWWRDSSGVDQRPRFSDGAPRAPVVGDAYDLRDVDCYDDSIFSAGGFSLGAPMLTNEPTC